MAHDDEAVDWDEWGWCTICRVNIGQPCMDSMAVDSDDPATTESQVRLVPQDQPHTLRRRAPRSE